MFVISFASIIFKITGNLQYVHTNVSSEASVSVLKTEPGYIPERGGAVYNMNDDDASSWWYGKVEEEAPNWIELAWENPRTIDFTIQYWFAKKEGLI